LSHLTLFFFVIALGVRAFAADSATSAPIVPKKTITLFDGATLAPFYVWLPKFGHEDPDHVFTVVDAIDGAPAIRISGQHLGGIVTRERYANYRLVAEYRWGAVTWAPRKDHARDSGVLLHCEGEDGAYAKDFLGAWLRSVEFQIIEGGTGDIILVGGYDRATGELITPRLTAKVRPANAPGQQIWDPAGALTEITKGRINWQYRDPEWKDTLGYRGPRDVEKPVGQWNHIEAICREGDVTYFLNGEKVMEGVNGSLRAGKLLFQSEGAEIYFRKIELHPLTK
jgi:hypothetical protein